MESAENEHCPCHPHHTEDDLIREKRPIAELNSFGYSVLMSTLAEIQEAVITLRYEEKRALSLWLNSQLIPEPDAEDEARLLRSLDEAIQDVDAGKGVSIDEARKLVRSWVAK